MGISLTLPNGDPADKVVIGMATVDIATLRVDIEVVGLDAEGNRMVTLNIPYQLDTLREIPDEEKESVVYAYFQSTANS